jgi:hypothetical protein
MLAVSAFPTGVWAYCAPRSWYSHFPGLGLTWLPQLGPYNEHFCSDIGATYIALTVLAAAAVIYVDNASTVKITGMTWLTFNALHLVFHLRTLQMYGPRDAVFTATVLGLLTLISAALLIPADPISKP